MSRFLALLCLLPGLGCGVAPPRGVVLIVVDTLRSDALGVYGASRDTSPALDAFSRQAVRFQRAYAPAPWTRPSVASVLTGLYPRSHRADRVQRPLSGDVVTLAEILSARGWQTGAVVSHFAIGAKAGFSQGFDVYRESEARGHRYVSTEGVTRQAVELLNRFAGEPRPFLLFVHYFDPHYDYIRHPEVGFAPERGGILTGEEHITVLRGMIDRLGDEELTLLRALYDEEIHHTDAGIGRLLDALAQRGLADDCVVVVTGDHGEEFLERGWIGHTRTLYEELMRVPLLVRAPKVKPRVVQEPVSTVSITPTVLELAGVEAPAADFGAPSLAGAVRGDAPPQQPILLDVRWKGLLDAEKRAEKSGVVEGRFKLVRDAVSGAVELYDLEQDPAERRDLSEQRPELRERLGSLLDAELRRAAGAAVDARTLRVTEREIERLRDLGYVEDAP
jgi:arylsulfatase A-like enzyme